MAPSKTASHHDAFEKGAIPPFTYRPCPLSHLSVCPPLKPPYPCRRNFAAAASPSSSLHRLFGCLGIAFKFTEIDYIAKVNNLLEASKSISTLPLMVELDIHKGTVRQPGSHTTNLLRVKRGIDMVKVLFEQILVTE